jgi:small subunit ribosomal protein S8
MINCPYADFIARLNNARRQHFKKAYVNNTNKVLKTLEILCELGIIKSYSLINGRTIEVELKFVGRRVVFKKLKIVSLPSKKIYVDIIRLSKLKDKSNCSFYILSTTKGILTDFECIINNVAGEVLLKVEL